MKAAVLAEAGGVPEATEFEDPEAGDGEQIADVLVAALNPIDRILASGFYGPPTVPAVIGREGIARLKDGSRVYFSEPRVPFGALAERVALGSGRVYPVPDAVDDGVAVALGISGTTATVALEWRGQLKPGETVLVLGASGVVGQIGVQVAKLNGAGRVVAAARHEPTLERLRSAGAADDTVVLEGDYAEAIKAAAPDGYDLVLDPIFGPPLEVALPATKRGGRYVVCGTNAGRTATIGYGDLVSRTLFGHVGFGVPEETWRGAYERLLAHVQAGELSVDVERFPLDRIGEAWELQGSAPHRKLVLEP